MAKMRKAAAAAGWALRVDGSSEPDSLVGQIQVATQIISWPQHIGDLILPPPFGLLVI
ncbi:hypothetical protein [Roseibium polysiphoniae]|uniref:hypothetical protein n=1 Tax=Roseibium polysiphoniae TaxID=2571221 RepID=UPI00329A35A8